MKDLEGSIDVGLAYACHLPPRHVHRLWRQRSDQCVDLDLLGGKPGQADQGKKSAAGRRR